MVAKIAVLGRVQRNGGQPFDGGYFTRIANPDYYAKGGEPPGRWYGAGAAKLKLSGNVDAQEFSNLLAGLRPDGSEFRPKKPTKRKQAQSKRELPSRPAKPPVPGYDICFSAPKSVSALWAVASTRDRKEIEQAFDVAVKSTLDWFAREIPLIRRGKGGGIRQHAELVIALFEHGSSRPSEQGTWDPQLHRHCVIANIACGDDGRWSAVNSRLLHEWTRTLGPVFRATFASELQARLGLGLFRPKDRHGQTASWFEIEGISKELCHHWSSRRSEIEMLLDGSIGLGNFSDPKAREAANLKSRNSKGEVPPRSRLFAEWVKVGRNFGLTKDIVENLKWRSQSTDPEKSFQQAWRSAQDLLDASESSFTYREAVQRVCEAAQTSGLSGDWLATRTRQALDESRAVRPLGIVKGEERYATARTWQTEQKLLAEFEKLRSSRGAAVNESMLAGVLAKHPYLMAEQREAIETIAGGTSSIRILTGVAGAGKSTTLNVIREAFERSGYKVIGGAIAGVATEELAEKALIPARTVASYLHHLDKPAVEKLIDRLRHDAKQLVRAAQGKPTYLPFKIDINKKTVLILDEAGMIDSATLLKLTSIVRERSGTLILVGDTSQLQAIGAGGGLDHLVSKERAPHLTNNLRQQDAADRKAADDLRRGDADAALNNYAERGRLVVTANRTEALTSLIKAWSDAGGATSPQEHVIFTPTRAEAEAANRLAQRARDAAGQIDRQHFLANGEGIICRGDRVLFHRNAFADGVRNGYRGEVLNVNRFTGKLTIRLDGLEGREVTIRLREYGSDGLSLSYAQTTHKAQSQTVANAYILVGGRMANREMAYVQASRGRNSTQMFVDEIHAGEELKDLARSLSRTRKQKLAHDIAAEAKSHSRKGSSPEREI